MAVFWHSFIDIPRGSQWVDLIEFIGAFEQSSQLYSQDNELKDCYRFFSKVAKELNFSQEFEYAY